METKPHFSLLATSFAGGPRPRNAALILGVLWLLIFFASLFAPPLLDDADATHAQAAQHIALTGHLVTLQVDGIRYLEKAPLLYWLVALSFKIFGFNTFAAHLPQAIAVALLALLGHRWANHAFGSRTAFYTALALLTSFGVFLFTRILIPEVWLSLFLATALYTFLRTILLPDQPTNPVLANPDIRSKAVILSEVHQSHRWTQSKDPEGLSPAPTSSPFQPQNPSLEPTINIPEHPATIYPLTPYYPYLMWASLALAVLTKGLVALVFFFTTTLLYLLLTANLKQIKLLKPLTGPILFLAIAAPWHILAALHNPATPTHQGFVWFYFWNEHVLRFLGRRTPADFNRLPGYLYWLQHLAWLFPWTLFLPLAITALVRRSNHQLQVLTASAANSPWIGFVIAAFLAIVLRSAFQPGRFTYAVLFAIFFLAISIAVRRRRVGLSLSPFHRIDPQQRHILLLALFATTVLLFFSLSTNQEYYTFPAYLPILLLISATITRAEQTYSSNPSAQRWITAAHATLTVLGAVIAIALLAGLVLSRNIPSTTDIGTLLAHRGLGNYTLSTSHLFDLTAPAFAALRLPAVLAALAFATGPTLAWMLRMQRRHLAATTTIAFTAAAFLIAAHLAFARFAPLLSSRDFAQTIQRLEATHQIDPGTPVLLYGDQAFGSSIAFYLSRPVLLVDGRSTSMQFGSTFPDAPAIFLTPQQLATTWGQGTRKFLFVPAERHNEVEQLLGAHPLVVESISGKELLTDRPMDIASKIP